MKGFQYRSGFFSHTGQRKRNEDFYILDDLNGIHILDDGMGGYPGGYLAWEQGTYQYGYVSGCNQKTN